MWRRTSGRTVLRNRDFRWLWTGQAVSAVGDMIFPVAVAVQVLDAGGDATAVGLVLGGRFAALVLFSLLGGVWADRLPRTAVMIGADVLRAVAVAGLALTPGTPPVLVLAGLTFLVGAGEAFFRPAYGALIPSVVPQPDLTQANALTGSSLHFAQVIGPGLGGVLVAVAGPRVAFGLDALTFAVSCATLLGVAEPASTPPERRSAVREIGEGVQAVRVRPWIGAVLTLAAAQLMLAFAPVMVLLPVIARERLGGASSYGLVLSAGAVGALVGALLAGRLRPARPGLVGILGLVPLALQPVALWVSLDLGWVCVLFFVAGLGLGPFIVYWESALQVDVPKHLLARVVSLDWMCSFALLPVGLALVGPVLHLVGRGPVLVVAALVQSVPTLLLLLVPGVPEFRTPATSDDESVGAAAAVPSAYR